MLLLPWKNIPNITLTKAYSFHQLITVATRPVSGTLLDHVLVNYRDNVLKSGTLSLTLSDHLPIYVSLKSRAIKLQSEGHKPMLFRSKKNFSVDTFLADLECLPWSTMDMYSEPNEALSHWYSLFKSVLDSHAPLKKRRVKREFIPEWFNSEIQAAIGNFRYIKIQHDIILERHVHQSFYYFLSQHDLLLDSQFGFRSSRSCELAM